MAQKMKTYCQSCGDICVAEGEHKPGEFKGRMLCWECLEELRDGKINTKPARTYPSGIGSELEDTGPYQDNAIRDMEE